MKISLYCCLSTLYKIDICVELFFNTPARMSSDSAAKKTVNL